MPRGPAPAWKARASHTIEALPYIKAALARGYDQELIINGIETSDRALFLKRGLFNAAKKFDDVSVHVRTERLPDGTYRLTFAVHDKRVARAYMIQRYGEDRSLWPYNPRQKGRPA